MDAPEDIVEEIAEVADQDVTRISATEFIPPSIHEHLLALTSGDSYTHYSSIPPEISLNNPTDNTTDIDVNALPSGTPVMLGIDEAGRGPVIGPMVYGLFYLPLPLSTPLLKDKHSFDDSKVLTPLVRAQLMRTLCTAGTDLYRSCGWAIKSLSAQDISSGMLRAGGAYNLNAQAMDATIEIIRGVIERGVNVVEVYVDTIGQPAAYQRKLERVFPTIKVVVEKKADSLFPCVSAASVVAKVSRDVSCEVLYQHAQSSTEQENAGWGSGYPSDARCVSWLKGNMDPMFGWGNETRFSWATVKDMLELGKSDAIKVDWPDDDPDANQLSQYFSTGGMVGRKTEAEELRSWYGSAATTSIF